jgi:hypothetical protein
MNRKQQNSLIHNRTSEQRLSAILLAKLPPGPLKSVLGQLPATDWSQVECSGVPAEFHTARWDSTDPGALSVRLDSDVLAARIEFAVDPELGCLSWKSRMEAKTDVEITRLVPLALELPPAGTRKIRVRSITGGSTHAQYPPQNYREFHTALSHGHDRGFLRTSGFPDGRSSGSHLPVFQVECPDCNGGLVGGLEWSGPWSLLVKTWHYGNVANAVWSIGIPVDGIPQGEFSYGGAETEVRAVRLAAGQSFDLPPAHLLVYEGNAHSGGNAFRRFLRLRHAAKLYGRPPLPPLSYDSWFGLGTRINPGVLRRQAERAAELGLEYFVIDAGWYAGCAGGDFMKAMGNWEEVDKDNFPDGLEPVVAMVREFGLKPGLFFEIARSHRSSRWVREHPDWFMDVGAPHLYLDFTRSEARDLVVRTVDGWVNRLGLEWLRWEMGFGPLAAWPAMRRDSGFLFRYEAGLHEILDTIRNHHPDLVVELCSEGGHRLDLATLKRGHTSWFSDACENPLTQRAMLCGANRFLPANFMNAAVPIPIGEGEVDLTDADIVSRMCGALSFGGCISRLSPSTTRRAAELIAIYRSFRHLLVQDFYPLTRQPQGPEEGEAVLFADYAKTEAVLMAFAGGEAESSPSQRLILSGLLREAIYEIKDLIGQRSFPALGGDALMDAGLEIALPGGIALIRFKVQN